jgi:hypothetical protein
MSDTGGASLADASASPEDKELAALRYGWGEAYRIGHDEARGWWASRRDDLGGDITAGGAEELTRKIQADYGLKKVPRELPGTRP